MAAAASVCHHHATEKRRANTAKRHARIVAQVSKLYDVRRKRLDDAYAQVADETGLSVFTVERIYNTAMRQAAKA